MNRRTALGIIVGAGTSFAGCVGFGGTNQTVNVTVENQGSATQEITIVVRFNDEKLVQQTMSVEAGERVDPSFKNPDSAGDATVIVQSDTGTEASANVRVGPGTGIRFITIIVEQDGTITINAART